MYTPSLPQLEALNTFTGIVSNPAGAIPDEVQGMLSPELKLALQVEDSFDREKPQISPEHVFWVDQLADENPALRSMLMKMMTGNPDLQPSEGLPQQGAVNNQIYYLTKPEDRRRYRNFNRLIGLTGASAAATDYPRHLSASGTVTGLVADEGGSPTVPFALGAGYYKSPTPTAQAKYDTMDRERVIGEELSNIRQIRRKQDEAGPSTPQQRAAQQRVEEKAAVKQEGRYQGGDTQRELQAIKKEFTTLKRRLKTGDITKKEAEAQRKRLVERYNSIQGTSY